MLPIRSDQYLLHTPEERAALMRNRQERVNVLLDLGCSQETIDQADARVCEIVEADKKAEAGAVNVIHDSWFVDFESAADARFAASQQIRRFMLNAPDLVEHVKIITDPPIMKRWFKDESPSGRIASDMDRRFLEGAGAFRTPRALKAWGDVDRIIPDGDLRTALNTPIAQVDYNALEQKVLAQALDAFKRLPKHAVSHRFDFGCRCTMLADHLDGSYGALREFIGGSKPLKRKHTGKPLQLRGDVKIYAGPAPRSAAEVDGSKLLAVIDCSDPFDDAMIDADGADLAGVA